jgi:hypothetical protein
VDEDRLLRGVDFLEEPLDLSRLDPAGVGVDVHVRHAGVLDPLALRGVAVVAEVDDGADFLALSSWIPSKLGWAPR